jgi:hypothetical protein
LEMQGVKEIGRRSLNTMFCTRELPSFVNPGIF